MGSDRPARCKRCPRCKEVKPGEGFVRNRSQPDGLGAYCKPCHRVIVKAHQERLYGGHRNFLLQLRYGISEAQFDKLVRKQGGTCAICRKRPAKHLDHNNRTGKVRGVLCFSCNRGLDKFQDSRRLMNEAVRYLGRYPPQKGP